MRALLRAFSQFSPRQKLFVGALLVLILVTWIAVCLVLTGVLGP